MSDLHVFKMRFNVHQGIVETFDHNAKPVMEIHECYKKSEIDAELDRLNEINHEMHNEINKLRKEKDYLKLEIKALKIFIKHMETMI